MKIALFTDSYTPEVNGVAVAVDALRRALLGRGHDVTVFGTSHPDAVPDPDVVRLPSVIFAPLPERRMATPIDPAVWARLKDGHFDLIHTHTEFVVGQFGSRAAARLELPRVHTYHTMYEDLTWYVARRGPLTQPASRLARFVSRRVCNPCDCVIAPTRKIRDKLLGYGVDTFVAIAPTGIDTRRFHSADERELRALRESLGIAPDARVVLYLGRVAYEKNITQLVEALVSYLRPSNPGLAERRRDVVVLIVGDGRAMGNVLDLVAASGLGNRVYFAGEVPWTDVPQYYHVSDAVVSMSEAEAQGLTFIESVAAGVPLVARYNECFDGILEDGLSASLFRRVEEFPRRLDEVLFTDRRENYIAGGRAAAEAVSLERFGERVEGIYRETIESHAAHHPARRRVHRRLHPARPAPTPCAAV